jgi:hypothetical protein
MKPSSATEQKEQKRRDSALPAEFRDLEKLVLAFAEEFSFASDEVERLKKKTAAPLLRGGKGRRGIGRSITAREPT